MSAENPPFCWIAIRPGKPAKLAKDESKDGSTPPPEDGGRNPTVNFKGEQRSNETHVSRTDPDARL
ncbi:hypothetical protein A1355_07020 [Methylomonas koyamae]|uniref:Uncharacterized protein n=1 Tax=Methylomonas koyamae TaxID=702114 RepID=A0A177NI79_9GAMM|nr:hypothetical protein A1355_07020 [Methylomonas koyamae]